MRPLLRPLSLLTCVLVALGLGLAGCGIDGHEDSPNERAPGSTQGRIPDRGPNSAYNSEIKPPPPAPPPPLAGDPDTGAADPATDSSAPRP